MYSDNIAIKEFWDTAHQLQNKLWLTGSDPNFLLKLYNVNPPSGRKVLDLGVGFGYFSELMYNLNNEVFAVDISESALQKVSSFAHTSLVDDLESIPEVDLAFCHLVLQHCENEMVQFIFNNIQLEKDGFFYFQFATLYNQDHPSAELKKIIEQGLLHFRDLETTLIMMGNARLLPVEIIQPFFFRSEDIIGWYLIKAKKIEHIWKLNYSYKEKYIEMEINGNKEVLNFSDNSRITAAFKSQDVISSDLIEKKGYGKSKLSLHFETGTIKILLAQSEHSIQKEKDFPKAEQILNLILELYPDYPDAYCNLAVIKYYTNDLGSARDYIEKALVLSPTDPIFLSNRKKIMDAIMNEKNYNNTTPDELLLSGTRRVRFTFDDISQTVLLHELPTSKIYLTAINDKELVFKVISRNPNMDFDDVLKSYQNVINLKNTEGLVSVYDYRISNDGQNFEVLMEYLNGYNDVESIDNDNRYFYATQILSIIENILNQGFIPIDCGLANFVTDGTSVKMLDLDLILSWNQVNYFNTNWFISRLQEIGNWCKDISVIIDNLISDFRNKRKNYFESLPYNPYAQKLFEEGEKILLEGGDVHEAVNKFQIALKYNPHSAALFNNLAVAYWNVDETDRTVALLKTAIEIEPNNETYISNYVDVLTSLNMQEEIQKVYNTFNQALVQKRVSVQNRKVESDDASIHFLQQEIDKYSYPSNYAYDLKTLKPHGSLETRVEYIVKYCPELYYPCKNFLSIGSSLGYMLLYHSFYADKCIGIEPDQRANEIVNNVARYKKITNIELHAATFKEFEKKEKYDLIWMGNVFQYMYVDYGWDVAEELANISNGKCIIEAPFEGEYLKPQAHLNANWKNEKLMNEYSLNRFKEEMGKFFDIISINPSGTDPVNRLLVVLNRK